MGVLAIHSFDACVSAGALQSASECDAACVHESNNAARASICTVVSEQRKANGGVLCDVVMDLRRRFASVRAGVAGVATTEPVNIGPS